MLTLIPNALATSLLTKSSRREVLTLLILFAVAAMAGLSPDSARERADDYSCDSDSGDTVVLKDDETYDRCEDGLSFVRFMSLEGGATTDGELITTAAAMNTSTSKLAPLPTGLSFLYNHPHFLNPSISPGSFMFTECRLQMEMDEEKPRQAVDSTSNFSTPISSASDTATFLAPNLVEIAPKPASPSPGYNQTQPSAPQPPLSENVSDSNHHFKHPKVIQLSDLRCKNREAARKCRAKKKNYIQQLEHDFKDLKEKYAIVQQENDDLKRFIFQHFGVNLTPKPSSSKASTPISVLSSLPVVVNGAPGTQVLPSGQPILLKVIQPPHQQQPSTADSANSATDLT